MLNLRKIIGITVAVFALKSLRWCSFIGKAQRK